MSAIFVLFIVVVLASFFYLQVHRRVSRQAIESGERSRSLLRYYGLLALIWCLLPALLVLVFYSFFVPEWIEGYFAEQIIALYPDKSAGTHALFLSKLKLVASGVSSTDDPILLKLVDEFVLWQKNASWARAWLVILVAGGGGMWALWRLSPSFAARESFERMLRRLLFVAACIAVLTTVAIVASLLFESLRFFRGYNFFDFLFGLHWSPNIALHADQAGSSGSFGMLPVLAGTVLISIIAMLVAVPIGLYAAIYMSEFAHPKVKSIVKPALEILAGIPTVVYGFFAALTVAPFFRSMGISLGLDVSSESALAAGAVMGMMIIPFISSLSDDVLCAVPKSLRDAALGLGATKAEMVMRVLLPAAFPGLVGAFLLAISRAIGETMIVVMAVGTAANLTMNPLESVTTVTVQIVGLLTGDTEFDSIKTLSAFALGITLFVLTLMLNVFALSLSRRLAERYE